MRALSAVLGLVVGGCTVPSPGTLDGWNIGEVRQLGSCEFRLLEAGYYHSTSWNLDVTVATANVGGEPTSCGWDAQLISGGNHAMTESVGAQRTYAAGTDDEMPRIAHEKNMSGFSGGPGDGAWVLMTVRRGQPFIGESQQFHTTAERIRPPG